MKYSIREISKIAGVSARTLRYYDQIDLLKPSEISEAGYRYYGEREVELLWQILFYKDRGMDLKQIRKIIYEKDFDIMQALQKHLRELEAERDHIYELIRAVKGTISARKGEQQMSHKEKFEVFKKRVVNEYEEQYGEEAREKYGCEEVDASVKKIMNMTEADWERFQNLGEEVRTRLEEGVKAKISPESDEARRIVMLHKEWLGQTWKQYSEEAHKALVEMYLADERFTAYYDRKVEGCAKLLEESVNFWIGK